ncbi:DUF3822 family protein [Mariniphaga sp.]|uniref:DUF3822 family protein n=1 Tax=Mariniphaga sp. TaxID=1954475 RepID=UPI003567C0B1
MIALTTDPGFDFNRTEKYKLSIQVSLDGFSFSVVDPFENRLLATGLFPITISSEKFLGRRFAEWLNDVEVLQKKYAEIKLFYFSEKFTLVPSSFYEFTNQNKVIETAFGKLNNNSVRDNYLPEDEANLIFSVPNSLKETFEKAFPGCIILHPISILSQKIHQNFITDKNERILALSFQNNFFSLLLFVNKKLQIINNYYFKHPNDVVFYVLSVLKSRNISPAKTALLLSGKINSSSEITASLPNYFSQTEFLKASAHYNENIFGEQVQQFTPVL